MLICAKIQKYEQVMSFGILEHFIKIWQINEICGFAFRLEFWSISLKFRFGIKGKDYKHDLMNLFGLQNA